MEVHVHYLRAIRIARAKVKIEFNVQHSPAIVKLNQTYLCMSLGVFIFTVRNNYKNEKSGFRGYID